MCITSDISTGTDISVSFDLIVSADRLAEEAESSQEIPIDRQRGNLISFRATTRGRESGEPTLVGESHDRGFLFVLSGVSFNLSSKIKLPGIKESNPNLFTQDDTPAV